MKKNGMTRPFVFFSADSMGNDVRVENSNYGWVWFFLLGGCLGLFKLWHLELVRSVLVFCFKFWAKNYENSWFLQQSFFIYSKNFGYSYVHRCFDAYHVFRNWLTQFFYNGKVKYSNTIKVLLKKLWCEII